MFSKPFNLILIYLLSIVNLLILLIPIIFIVSPLFLVSQKHFTQGIIDTAYISFFILSSIMIFYLMLDTIFGFTIWGLTKNSKPAHKYKEKYKFVPKLIENFDKLQKKFGTSGVELLISNDSNVNAYAIGSMRKRIVVVTLGLISHIRRDCQSEEDFQIAVEAIMGHELSHLVNKDFLPTLLLLASDKATNFVLRLVSIIFNIVIRLVYRIPFVGGLLYTLIIFIHKFTNFILNFFHRYILLNIFEFLKLHISRQTEYRCDYQAAQACGGGNMAYALSFLGSNGFITLFSTHPRTQWRISNVKNVNKKEGKIRISFINRISNFSSISLLFLVLFVSWDYVSQIEYLQVNQKHKMMFNQYHTIIQQRMHSIQRELNKLF